MFREVFPLASIDYVSEIFRIFEELRVEIKMDTFKHFFQDISKSNSEELSVQDTDPDVVELIAKLFVDKFLVQGGKSIWRSRQVGEVLELAKVLNSRSFLEMLLAHMEAYPEVRKNFLSQLEHFHSSKYITWNWEKVGGRLMID